MPKLCKQIIMQVDNSLLGLKTGKKMLESRPEDALVKLVKLLNIVKLVKLWRLY